jgi:hypothetical protein
VNRVVVQTVKLPSVQDLRIQGPKGETLVRVEKDKIWVVSSPCPQKICSRMGKINRPGQILVCVPNRLVVRIQGTRSSDTDAVTM